MNLDEIERRAAEWEALRSAATEGEWRRCGGATARYVAIHSKDHGYIVFGMADARSDSEGGKFIQAPNYPQQASNAAFIAHARSYDAAADITALVAEIKMLRRRLAERDENALQ